MDGESDKLKTVFDDYRIGDRVRREGFDQEAYPYVVTGLKLGFGDETTITDNDSGKERTVKTSELTLLQRAIYLDAEEQARIKNAMTLLDERGMWMASGHLKEILKKATS